MNFFETQCTCSYPRPVTTDGRVLFWGLTRVGPSVVIIIIQHFFLQTYVYTLLRLCKLNVNLIFINRLMGTANYSATSNNVKLQPAQAPPHCAKCKNPHINGLCTNHRIALVRCSVPIKGLKMHVITTSVIEAPISKAVAAIVDSMSLSRRR